MAKRKTVPKTALELEMLEKLGDRLKSVRKQKGFNNYEKFSYEINFGRSQYGGYENGKDIQFSTLVRLADAMGMTLIEFFSEGFYDKQ